MPENEPIEAPAYQPLGHSFLTPLQAGIMRKLFKHVSKPLNKLGRKHRKPKKPKVI